MAPLSSVTSTSTVGLPRLSRISRAWMSAMAVMGLDVDLSRSVKVTGEGPVTHFAMRVVDKWSRPSPG